MARTIWAALALCAAACSGGTADRNAGADEAAANVALPAEDNAVAAALPPAAPPEPGTPGGLPDDRTPVSEARFAPTSAQGAADLVQHYFALLEQRRFAEARRLWGEGGAASGIDEAAFSAQFARFAEYHAQVGAPGRIEGAAGSLYVEVPVAVYGRLRGGEPFNRRGTIRLRRVNDVPGSTEAQRRWHIVASEEVPPEDR